MWIMIFTLILLMAVLVRGRDRTNNHDNIFNGLLLVTTCLLVYALGQEIHFN